MKTLQAEKWLILLQLNSHVQLAFLRPDFSAGSISSASLSNFGTKTTEFNSGSSRRFALIGGKTRKREHLRRFRQSFA